MYIVKVEKECGCFKKSIYKNTNNLIFDSKEDALKEAQAIQKFMNTNFCGKHHFRLKEYKTTMSICANIY